MKRKTKTLTIASALILLAAGAIIISFAYVTPVNPPPELLPISERQNDQYDAKIVATKNEPGGISDYFIFWEDKRNNDRRNQKIDIYSQRLEVNDTRGANYMCLYDYNQRIHTNNAEEQINAQAIPDGEGGTYIVWQDKRNGRDYDIYGQRLNKHGLKLWGRDGKRICRWRRDQVNPAITSCPGVDGFCVVWQDSADSELGIQWIDGNGDPLSNDWPDNGYTLGIFGKNPKIAPFLNGVIIVYEDDRNDSSKLCVSYMSDRGTTIIREDVIKAVDQIYVYSDFETAACYDADGNLNLNKVLVVWKAKDRRSNIASIEGLYINNLLMRRIPQGSRYELNKSGIKKLSNLGGEPGIWSFIENFRIATGNGHEFLVYEGKGYFQRMGAQTDIFIQKIELTMINDLDAEITLPWEAEREYYIKGQNWHGTLESPAIVINDGNNNITPQVIATPDGGALVVYGKLIDNYTIHMKRMNSFGEPDRRSIRIRSTRESPEGILRAPINPRIAPFGDNGALVVWEEADIPGFLNKDLWAKTAR